MGSLFELSHIHFVFEMFQTAMGGIEWFVLAYAICVAVYFIIGREYMSAAFVYPVGFLILTVFNPFLIVPMLAWFTAQVLKTIIHAIINKKLDITRMCGDGGMPSGHSATVSSLAVLAALVYGCGSFQFAFAAVLAIIVCHDASGVRLQTGKQAEVLNDLIEIIDMLTTEKSLRDT